MMNLPSIILKFIPCNNTKLILGLTYLSFWIQSIFTKWRISFTTQQQKGHSTVILSKHKTFNHFHQHPHWYHRDTEFPFASKMQKCNSRLKLSSEKKKKKSRNEREQRECDASRFKRYRYCFHVLAWFAMMLNENNVKHKRKKNHIVLPYLLL